MTLLSRLSPGEPICNPCTTGLPGRRWSAAADASESVAAIISALAPASRWKHLLLLRLIPPTCRSVTSYANAWTQLALRRRSVWKIISNLLRRTDVLISASLMSGSVVTSPRRQIQRQQQVSLRTYDSAVTDRRSLFLNVWVESLAFSRLVVRAKARWKYRRFIIIFLTFLAFRFYWTKLTRDSKPCGSRCT